MRLLEDFVKFHTGKLQNRMDSLKDKLVRGDWIDPLEAKKQSGRYLGLEAAQKDLMLDLKEFRRLIDED